MDKAECNHDSAGEGTRDLRCGCELPYVGCLAFGSTVAPSDPELPVCSGTVNGTTVSVLRDTGCTTAVIKRTLVTAEQLTGRFKCYRMIDGTVRRAETASVHVDSSYFTGEVECICFDTPICDVVIGNIPDAKMGNSLETTAAVLTRAQSIANGKPSRSLSVPMSKSYSYPWRTCHSYSEIVQILALFPVGRERRKYTYWEKCYSDVRCSRSAAISHSRSRCWARDQATDGSE